MEILWLVTSFCYLAQVTIRISSCQDDDVRFGSGISTHTVV